MTATLASMDSKTISFRTDPAIKQEAKELYANNGSIDGNQHFSTPIDS